MNRVMKLAIILGTLGASANSQSQVTIERCGDWKDSLDAAQAEGRREWAKKCVDPVSRSLINGQQWFVDTSTAGRRRAYPVFGIANETGDPTNPANYFAPTDSKAACNLPEGYTIVMFCGAGCYTPEQALLFPEGYAPIKDAKNAKLTEIVTVSPNSTTERLRYKSSKIDSFMADYKAFKQKILTIRGKSGGSLRVTENHPIVDGQGRMRAASDLVVGESLVTADGKTDPIVEIVAEEYFGKVYNVSVDSTDLLENIVIAQGYLNGSLLYQNEGTKHLNQALLRTNLIPDSLVR